MQGFNMGRYYPPDTENAPTFNTSHPLGRRANKISQGILTVRFELPFAVWCDTCKPTALIGQGVRFNAEKKKVGNYYSTPIWQFRMKHSACGGWWEIRTDPKNAEYIVVEGAKRRDYGDGEKGDLQEGDLKFLTEEEREKRREDAFANLEGKLEDKGNEKKNRERVEELYDAAEVWRDPYDVNAKLRRDFRQKRKVWQKDDRKKEGMQNKFSLGIEIADEIDTDRVKAGLIEFGGGGTNDQRVEEASRKPLFASNEIKQIEDGEKKSGKLKSEILAAKSRQNLQQTLVGNTRATIDPFLSRNGTVAPKMNLGILKRKRGNEPHPSSDTLAIEGTPRSIPIGGEAPAKRPVLSTALVDYDSD